jgi:NTP pyrophosphatase (non-canonical NTP hydrolase)
MSRNASVIPTEEELMELSQYQKAAGRTMQPLEDGSGPLVVPLLGMIGEAAEVATTYKKHLRDGAANPTFKAQIREELGDVLWYVAVLARQVGLDLDDIAAANLSKVADRWRPTSSDQIVLDESYPPEEQLPRRAKFIFALTETPDGRKVSTVTCDGVQVGDPITDASRIEDGYCFHDVFHLAHATVLGWSPVLRSLMKRKRRSDPRVDDAEDGGRAIVVEEGIAALVFAYASEHHYLEGKTHVDTPLLDTIRLLVAQLEVGVHRAADWEKTILAGYEAWRQLRLQGGGVVEIDLATQSLRVS